MGLVRKPGRRQTPPTLSKAPTLSAKDKEGLQRSINRLRNAHKTKDPIGFLTSEGTQLLAASPSEIYDRLVSFISNVALVAGLVLSATAGVALEPLDPEEFSDEKRMLAETYNVLAALTVVIQLMVVLFSTYTLYVITASVHSPTAAYRATLHMTRWIGFLEFGSYLPAMGTLGLIVLAAQLRSGEIASWVVLIASISVWVVFQFSFDVMISHATPFSGWRWSFATALGIPWLSGRAQNDARVQGEMLVEQAKEGVLGGLDEDDDYVIDSVADPAAAETAVEEMELAAWLQGVLILTPTASSLLAQRLFAAGLTHTRMVEAATLPGGFQALCEMLAASELGLRPGDRLALASASAGRSRAQDAGEAPAASRRREGHRSRSWSRRSKSRPESPRLDASVRAVGTD